jgi:hypothetical protein
MLKNRSIVNHWLGVAYAELSSKYSVLPGLWLRELREEHIDRSFTLQRRRLHTILS